MTFDKIKRCDADLLATYETILKNLGFSFTTSALEGDSLIHDELEHYSIIKYEIATPEGFKPEQFQKALTAMTYATPEDHRLLVMSGWSGNTPGYFVRVDIYRRNFTDEEYHNDLGGLLQYNLGFMLLDYQGPGTGYLFQCPQRQCDKEVKE